MKKSVYWTILCFLSLPVITWPMAPSTAITQLSQHTIFFTGIIGLFTLKALTWLRQIFSTNRYIRILGHDPHIVVPPVEQCKDKVPMIILPGYNSWRSSLPQKHDRFAVTTSSKTVHITIRFADTIRRDYRWLPLQWLKCITSASMGQQPDATALLCGLIECYEKGYTKVHSFWYSRGGPAGIYALEMLLYPQKYYDVWRSVGYVDNQGKLKLQDITGIYQMVISGKISITYPILSYPGTLKQCLNTALKTVHNYIAGPTAYQSKKTVWARIKRTVGSLLKRCIYFFGIKVLRLITRYREQKQEPFQVLLKLVKKHPELRKNLIVNFAEIDQITGNVGKRALDQSELVTTKTYDGDHFSINLPLKELQKEIN